MENNYVTLSLLVNGELVAYKRVALCHKPIDSKKIEGIKTRWYHLYALKNRREWQMFIEIPAGESIKFQKKNCIFDSLNTKQNENANTEQ